MQITENFSLEEFTRSNYATRHGIDNIPNENEIYNISNLCKHTLQPLRNIVKRVIHISSGFRCTKLNKKIKGADNSQHIKGQAADIWVTGKSTIDIIKLVVENRIEFDQMIDEFSEWVHISYNQENNRGNILQAYKNSIGKTEYRTLQI